MENSFTISFFHEGEPHKGIITPSEKVNPKGMPIYFRVALDGHFFGYLCCGDKGWVIDQERQKTIVDKIGEQVQWHYGSITNGQAGNL